MKYFIFTLKTFNIMLKEEKENGKISSGTEFSEQRILNQTNRISGAQPRAWCPQEMKNPPGQSVLPQAHVVPTPLVSHF